MLSACKAKIQTKNTQTVPIQYTHPFNTSRHN